MLLRLYNKSTVQLNLDVHVQKQSVELIDETLSEISRVANEYFICSIASVYSGEEVDGDNLHIIVEDQNWWEAKLSAHFESVKRYKTGYRGAAEYGFVCKINKGEK